MGYEVKEGRNTETFVLIIPEMDCSEKISAIKKKTDLMPGIISSKFYPVSHEVRFTVDPRRICRKEIEEAIKELGLTAILKKEEQAQISMSGNMLPQRLFPES